VGDRETEQGREGESVTRIPGTIKRLVRDKGFGFVGDQAGVEYFFHRTAIADFDALHDGDVVTFEAVPSSPKGPRAEAVEVVR